MKIAEASKKYNELLSAKENETANYQVAITKLEKFKNQVIEINKKNRK